MEPLVSTGPSSCGSGSFGGNVIDPQSQSYAYLASMLRNQEVSMPMITWINEMNALSPLTEVLMHYSGDGSSFMGEKTRTTNWNEGRDLEQYHDEIISLFRKK